MALLYLGIWRPNPKPVFELCQDAGSMPRVKQWMILPILQPIIADVADQVPKGGRRRTQTEDGKYAAHAFHHPEGVVAVIGAECEYDQVAAQMILNRVLDQFLAEHPKQTWATGNKTLKPPTIDGQSPLELYKDPGQINKLAAIQKDLDETLQTMRKTIEQTTMRGERLDALVDKSENLTSASKMFYQSAKKQNSCCVLM